MFVVGIGSHLKVSHIDQRICFGNELPNLSVRRSFVQIIAPYCVSKNTLEWPDIDFEIFPLDSGVGGIWYKMCIHLFSSGTGSAIFLVPKHAENGKKTSGRSLYEVLGAYGPLYRPIAVGRYMMHCYRVP